jgi:NADH-quinone oxidoreductase subunit C
MTNSEMARQLQSHFPKSSVSPRFHNQLEVITDAQQVPAVLATMREIGFEHLSNVTCVDWLAYNRFDVTYNVWSYRYKLHAVVKAHLDREPHGGEPEIPTALHVWPQAQAYEREIHEMFGIVFVGNPDLSPLFLHNWKDIPPLRKDFDTVEYAKQAYGLGGDGEPEGEGEPS